MSPAAPSGGARVRAALVIGLTLVLSSQGIVSAVAAPAGGNKIWVGRVSKAGYPYGGEALSPDGATVVVTGESGTTGAYDAATGTKRWIAAEGSIGTYDTFEDVAISPDGTRAYVVGHSYTNPKDSLLLVSYDLATGAKLWSVLYDGPTQGGLIGRRVAVSRDGSTVYVTSDGIDTLAYTADTGTKLWETLYSAYFVADLALSPDGSTLFVEGAISHVSNDFVTIAYDATTGTQLWLTQYNSGGTRGDTPAAIAVAPDGSTVFVTGCTGDFDQCVNGYFVTIAYGATTGAQLWIAMHQGAGQGDDSATDLTVSPDGSVVYVVGYSESKQSYDYAVVAYAAATGSVVWTSSYRGAGNENDYPCCVAVSPDGTRLYVTGDTGVNWATVSFDAATGKQQWAATYDGPGHGTDLAFALAVSPDGTQVYVTGSSLKVGYDFTTIDYSA